MGKTMYLQNKDFFKKYSGIKSRLIKRSKEHNDLFSICIPTYGRADLLKEALESCINQSYAEPFEIIVVDNDPIRQNDTEKLIACISDPRLTYYKNEQNIGCLGNFNRCIELTNSQYMIMLHTDDLLDKNYLNSLVPVIKKNPGIDILIPGKRIIRNNEIEQQKGYAFLAGLVGMRNRGVKLNIKDFSLYNITGGPLGIIMRKSMCLDLGGFDESVFPMSDYAFWVRASIDYNVVHLPMVLGEYRFFGNISSEKGMQLSYIENEFKLIMSIIKDKEYENAFKNYLYEYVRYRLKKSKIYTWESYVSITNQTYRRSLKRKLIYYKVVVSMALSYKTRAFVSDIKA